MAQLQWFYSSSGTQAGPVDAAGLQQLAVSGQLKPTDLVWRDGLTDWSPASTVPGLFPATPVPVPAAPFPSQSAGVLPYVGGAGTMSNEAGVSPRVVALLAQTRPWVRLFSVLMFIGAGLTALIGDGLLIVMIGAAASGGGSGAEAVGIIGGIMAVVVIVVAVLAFFPALYLSRYATRIGRFCATGHTNDLEAAIDAQKSFWKFVGILALVYVTLHLLGFVLGLLSGFR